MNKNLKQFLMINFGLIIMAVGLHFFLIASDLATGGVTGLAMVINHYFQFLPIGGIMLAFNVLLFILAYLMIGKEFTGYTLYCSFALSGMIYLLDVLFPMSEPIVPEILLNLIFGILIQGIGMGIVFYQNASTGGTDIIAKIINKYTHMEIGMALLISDMVVVLLAGMAFGFSLGLWALLGIMINGIVIDRVIAGFEMKLNVMIITCESESVNRYIIDVLDRTTTIFKAQGGYTGSERHVIQVLLDKRQYIKLKQYIRNVDRNAFISVTFTHEVLGEGFNTFLNASN